MLSLGWGLIWTIINLIVLYLLLKKFLIGPLLGIMEKRKTLIAQQLENARTTEGKANELKGQYEMAISGAKSESAQIIEEANADARTLTERTVREANEQAARILESARKTAEQETENALAGAKSEIAGLAVEAAKKMLAGGSEAGSRMLYDTFLAEAGDADDRESE